jgi:hypothetical protein
MASWTFGGSASQGGVSSGGSKRLRGRLGIGLRLTRIGSSVVKWMPIFYRADSLVFIQKSLNFAQPLPANTRNRRELHRCAFCRIEHPRRDFERESFLFEIEPTLVNDLIPPVTLADHPHRLAA